MKDIRLTTQAEVEGFIEVDRRSDSELKRYLTLEQLIFCTIKLVDRGKVSVKKNNAEMGKELASL